MSYKEPEMWEHYCKEEHSMMGVGKGEPCNWCQLTEEEHMKEKDMIAMMMEDNRGDHINPDREPSPYRNEFAEAVEILQRMNDKLDRLLEQQEKHLEEGHPRDDGK